MVLVTFYKYIYQFVKKLCYSFIALLKSLFFCYIRTKLHWKCLSKLWMLLWNSRVTRPIRKKRASVCDILFVMISSWVLSKDNKNIEKPSWVTNQKSFLSSYLPILNQCSTSEPLENIRRGYKSGTLVVNGLNSSP